MELPVLERLRSPRARDAFFKMAPAASCRKGKKKSLVLILSTSSAQSIKINMTKKKTLVNFFRAQTDRF